VPSRGLLVLYHVFKQIAAERDDVELLIEAMSAGLACVHPNFGALYETAGGMTLMYQWHEDPAAHALIFYQCLTRVIDALRAGDAGLRAAQKSYADARYDWGVRASGRQGGGVASAALVPARRPFCRLTAGRFAR
jgi:hypothetical protein